MVIERQIQLFGSRARTSVLIAIRLLEETYPAELASLLGLGLYSVQRILTSFERESVIASRSMGRTRQVSLNPRYFAHRDLAALLWTLGERDTDLQRLLAAKRRRPRRAGKPGL